VVGVGAGRKEEGAGVTDPAHWRTLERLLRTDRRLSLVDCSSFVGVRSRALQVFPVHLRPC
jgi:hypothetical protein